MRADFRREYQIAWALAEADRMRQAFGGAITIECHVIENVFTRGERVLTIRDPEGTGVDAALCLRDQSEEGSFWKAELLPVPAGSDEDVPHAKALQEVALEMRYNRCVHASYGVTVGAPSGEGGRPDFAEGLERLIRGEVRVGGHMGMGGAKSAPYGRASA